MTIHIVVAVYSVHAIHGGLFPTFYDSTLERCISPKKYACMQYLSNQLDDVIYYRSRAEYSIAWLFSV